MAIVRTWALEVIRGAWPREDSKKWEDGDADGGEDGDADG